MTLRRRRQARVRRKILIRVTEPTRSARRKNQLLTGALFKLLEGGQTTLDKVTDWDPDAGCVELLVRCPPARLPVPEGTVEITVTAI